MNKCGYESRLLKRKRRKLQNYRNSSKKNEDEMNSKDFRMVIQLKKILYLVYPFDLLISHVEMLSGFMKSP